MSEVHGVGGAAPPRLSIIVPTLNAERYFAETLRSIERQSIDSLEVLVIDGGSTDGTRDIALSSSLELQWIPVPGAGQAAALNHGFSLATGEVLGWLNADDMYEPHALNTVLDFFKNNPATAFVYGDAVAIDAAGRRFGIRQHVRASTTDTLLLEDCIVQPSAFWRADIWAAHGPLATDLDCVFDYDFFIRVSLERELRYIPVLLSAERLHADQKTAVGGLVRLDELARLNELHTGASGPPASFAAELNSTLLIHAAQALRRGRTSEARRFVDQMHRPYGSPLVVVGRTMVGLMMGDSGLIKMALSRNLARYQWRRFTSRAATRKWRS